MIDRCIIAGMSQACDESQALDMLKCLVVKWEIQACYLGTTIT